MSQRRPILNGRGNVVAFSEPAGLAKAAGMPVNMPAEMRKKWLADHGLAGWMLVTEQEADAIGSSLTAMNQKVTDVMTLLQDCEIYIKGPISEDEKAAGLPELLAALSATLRPQPPQPKKEASNGP